MNKVILALLLWCAPTTDARADECRAIAESVVIAAESSGHDAWRLAALVVRESGVRLDRVGKLGECGPAQVLGRYIGMTCEELQTPDGGIIGATIALRQWELARPDADPWQCYASGNLCEAPRSVRRLDRIANELRALVAQEETWAP